MKAPPRDLTPEDEAAALERLHFLYRLRDLKEQLDALERELARRQAAPAPEELVVAAWMKRKNK